MSILALTGKYTTQLFVVPLGDRHWYNVIGWWEKRRLAYNAFLFLTGLVTGILFAIVDVLPPVAENTDWDPLLSAIFMILAANLFYTLGWIIELVVRVVTVNHRQAIGPRLLRAGLVFSGVVAFAPVAWNTIQWVGRLLK